MLSSTYSVSSDRVSDSSSELRCLGSPYMHIHHTYIHTTCKRHVNKMLSYRRETALQSALVLAKIGRLELEDNILRTL